jgi:hypothetical protein
MFPNTGDKTLCVLRSLPQSLPNNAVRFVFDRCVTKKSDRKNDPLPDPFIKRSSLSIPVQLAWQSNDRVPSWSRAHFSEGSIGRRYRILRFHRTEYLLAGARNHRSPFPEGGLIRPNYNSAIDLITLKEVEQDGGHDPPARRTLSDLGVCRKSHGCL